MKEKKIFKLCNAFGHLDMAIRIEVYGKNKRDVDEAFKILDVTRELLIGKSYLKLLLIKIHKEDNPKEVGRLLELLYGEILGKNIFRLGKKEAQKQKKALTEFWQKHGVGF